MKLLNISYIFFIVFVFSLFTCENDNVGSGGSNNAIDLSSVASPPLDVTNITNSIVNGNIVLKWQVPALTTNLKRKDGKTLTKADISYKVYRVVKGAKSRTIAQIKTVDKKPITVAKGTTSTTISNLTGNTTYEIVVQAVNSTDTTKVSTGVRAEVTTLSSATAPAEVSTITAGSTTASSTVISWTAPTLDTSHKKADGTALTKADVSYKVYRVAKGSDERTVAQIKSADTSPLAVAKGTTSTTISNLTGSTTYEIVVQAVNSTDATKASIGKRIEVTTTVIINQATAPAEASTITAGSTTASSTVISWTAPTLDTSHKKADGTALIKADVSYKVYRVAKGSDERTVAQIKTADTSPLAVAKGTTSTTISNLTGNTTYEIVVQAVNSTDTTKASIGKRIEVTTTNPATAPAEVSAITAGSTTASSTTLSWTAPTLDTSHKKADGTALTKADVSYKVYRVAKGSDERTVAQIKTADTSPLAVTKGTISKTINNLTGSTTYEIVVQAVNSTDITKASTGKRIEVTTLNPANAPTEVSTITASSTTASSTVISWTAPTLTTSHKKADGGRLTTADVSYKIYRVAKGSKARTVAEIKRVDPTPLKVTKGTTRITITNLNYNTAYEIVVQAVNSTDTTKVSTGIRKEVTTNRIPNIATAPTEVTNITAGSTTASSTVISWTAPTLTNSHKKANGQNLTTADVSYKIYRVAKGSDERTVAQIKTADTTPIAVAKGTTRTTISNLTGSTIYEIVVQAVNSTDTTKVSTGVRAEVTTLNPANAPAEVSNVTAGSTTDKRIEVTWQAPTLTNDHKKANGETLTTADVFYKVYRVAKGSDERTVAEIKTADTSPLEVARGITTVFIPNLTGSTTYEIVVQAVNSTDTTKASTGVRAEVTTTNPANAPAEVSNITVGSTTASSTTLSWTAPTLDNSHKKANGETLTTADVSYKVYRVAKGKNARDVAEIKTADKSPLAVAKGTISKTINNLAGSTTYEIVVQAVNSTDTTKASTGVRAEVTTLSSATAPAEVSNVSAGSTTASSTVISWTAPTLDNSHKKADGTALTKADVSYKVYRVAKGSDERTVAEIKTADKSPLAVTKGTISKTINNLTGSTTYEIVVQAVNSTDTTKVSTGKRIEVTTSNPANAPAEVSNVSAGSTTASSTVISWTAPTLDTSHKKADGTALTKADVSYKVYRVAKGSDERTVAEIKTADKSPLAVTKGTISKTISNLTGSTTYEIVVQAVNSTDTTKVSTGVRAEVTTLSSATAPAEVSNVSAGSTTASSTVISWTAPTLDTSHKKADGTALTKADVSYKVYRVAKGKNARDVAEIKTADKSPLAVTKGTISKTISNLTGSTTYEIVVQAVNSTDTTKASTGKRIEVTTLNPANAPAEVSNVSAGSTTASSTVISWTAPTLDNSHKKADGTALTKADVSYKVYRVAKGSDERTVAEIKTADKSPLAVTKGTISKTINNLTGSTTYEIVVQAVNSTDTTKVSTGVRAEVTTLSSATAPAEVSNVSAGSTTASSTTISWTAPTLDNSHKKADGTALTKADVSYKVYRVAKGKNARDVAEIKTADKSPLAVTKGTISKTISNLTGSTTYEIVVQAVNSTDTTKASTGKRIEVTTTNPANAPAEVSNITAGNLIAGTPYSTGITISWTAPTLDNSHKKADGTALTTADVSYKVYRVAERWNNPRTVAQIKTADTSPLEVTQNTTSINITNLVLYETYEIVVQAVNSTDTTKISTGIKKNITLNSNATDPAEVNNVTGTPADKSARISWEAPTLKSSHKKSDGTQLTTAEVSYKVYAARRKRDEYGVYYKERTVAQIIAGGHPISLPAGTTSTNINTIAKDIVFIPKNKYEIVVQAVNVTDTSKVSTGVRIEITTISTNHATAPPDPRSVLSYAAKPSNRAVTISWITSTLTNNHKKPDGTKLAKTDIDYYVYHLEKASISKTVEQIKNRKPIPILVLNGATNVVISNLKPNTTYEVVVQAVNSIDTRKKSTGIRIEVTTLVTLNELVFKVKGNKVTYEWVHYPETANIEIEQTPYATGKYSISPNLTADTGLSFDTKTGRIYGQPTKSLKTFNARKYYTVKFTANDGRIARGTILLKVTRNNY